MSERTAFVFAGGGSLGAIQVGALRELVRQGIEPDFVVGASVGALNACYFASRPTAEGVEELEAIWRSLTRNDVFPITFRGMLGWLRGSGSVFESKALRDLVERRLPLKHLEDATVPVHVVATDLAGAPKQLSRGLAVDAVLASAAIPIAFPAVKVGDDYLMDGAIAGNTPILTAAELGATRIIVLQTGYACSIDGPPRGAIARGMHALTLLISNQMERDLRLLEGKLDIHVAPHLCPLDVSPFDFSHAADLIERSARTTRDWIAAGGLNRLETSRVFNHTHGAMQSSMPAFGGHDLVAYFVEPKGPTPGNPDFKVEHAGRTYLFANKANKDAFAAQPDRYLPQFGGQCAFALASGQNIKGDPHHFKVVDGKLYFNLNADIHAKWERNLETFIRRADEHWIQANH
ncbi:MAG: YHS domain-containing (seleno)protein [Caulobacterales bacterium]